MITAPTLKGAYKLVKQTYGDDAIILGSRTVTRRQPMGLGHEKFVEVTVQPPGMKQVRASGVVGSGSPTANFTSDQLLQEVERIESLVAELSDDLALQGPGAGMFHNNPLARSLMESGASSETVDKYLTRFLSETGQNPDNRAAALAWFEVNLKASNCGWDGFYGCHAFMGPTACGGTEMTLAAAAKLQELGRRTLVLSVMPPHNGRIKQLQVEAARLGFDAAVIQKPQQLTRSEKHLDRYEVVLVDMPAIDHPQMDEGRILHGWLSQNTRFHRHMIVPAFYDPQDMGLLEEKARTWNCDWLGLGGLDVTRQPGKILEYIERIALPMSLLGWAGHLEIATSGALLDFILGEPLDNIGKRSRQQAEG